MSQTSAHLNAMGIERWRLRDTPTDVEINRSAYCIRLFQQERCVGFLLAEGASQSEEEAALVQAMAKATGYIAKGAWEASLPAVSELTQSGAVMIVLGAGLACSLLSKEGEIADLRQAVHELGGCPVIATYSPAALLSDRSLKAAAWHDIKKAMQLMKEHGAF